MSVTSPGGFVASGLACGIKSSGALDLALVATTDGKAVPAAAVFTANKATAAPVQVSRAHLAASGGYCGAVVLSSGNANAATGSKGISDAERMCSLVADGLGLRAQEVLVCQTGLIGIPLPIEVVAMGIGPLVASRSAGPDDASSAARAIMTTDTIRKEVVVEGKGFTVGAMAKGAAMLAPNMATMLAVLTCDAVCDPENLEHALEHAVGASFNRLSVDGCTSTNDTVIVLASGASGTQPEVSQLTAALSEACNRLARMMADDAEGATKVANIVVKGAASDQEAYRAARNVAESNLVKCSLNGNDPYWGRVVSELGSAGVEFDLDKVEVAYGGIVVCRDGIAVTHDPDALAIYMKQPYVEVDCDLGVGSGVGSVLTVDLGHGYIEENRTTS